MAEVAQKKLIEHEGYWSLPIKGFRIIQLRLDYAFGMEIGDADSEFSLRVNTTFKLEDSEGIPIANAEIVKPESASNETTETTASRAALEGYIQIV